MTHDHKAALEYSAMNYELDPSHCPECNLAACYLDRDRQHKELLRLVEEYVAANAVNERLSQQYADLERSIMDGSHPNLIAERKAREEAEQRGTMPWVQRLEQRAEAAESALTTMTQYRDVWKHRYGQMDDARITAESKLATVREECAKAYEVAENHGRDPAAAIRGMK